MMKPHRGNRVLRPVVVAAAAVAAFAGDTTACPICFSADESSRAAFLLTTIVMSSLPLAMIGTLVVMARHRMKVIGQGKFDAKDQLPGRE